MLAIWAALLALWHNFWAQLRLLGVTFGAFWMHILCQKTGWGALLVAFWRQFSDVFRIFSKKVMCFTYVSVFDEF